MRSLIFCSLSLGTGCLIGLGMVHPQEFRSPSPPTVVLKQQAATRAAPIPSNPSSTVMIDAAFEERDPLPSTGHTIPNSSAAGVETKSGMAVSTSESALSLSASPADVPRQELLRHLKHSLATMHNWPAYVGTLEQQVRIKGELREPVLLDFKVRHSPFSVYLKWKSDGQEALYVEGENGGRLLAHPTRGLAALKGTWRLRPDSQQAMRDFLHPVTEFGIQSLTAMTWRFYEARDFSRDEMKILIQPCLANGLPATRYVVEFAGPQVSQDYSKSVLTFDSETGLLVAMENYDWTREGQQGPLLERYLYHGLRAAPELKASDFSERNPEYQFR
jgi:hypothetical protein